MLYAGCGEWEEWKNARAQQQLWMEEISAPCYLGLSELHIPPSFLSLAQQGLPGCSHCIWDGVLQKERRHN